MYWKTRVIVNCPDLARKSVEMQRRLRILFEDARSKQAVALLEHEQLKHAWAEAGTMSADDVAMFQRSWSLICALYEIKQGPITVRL